jgi:hypothetical protein
LLWEGWLRARADLLGTGILIQVKLLNQVTGWCYREYELALSLLANAKLLHALPLYTSNFIISDFCSSELLSEFLPIMPNYQYQPLEHEDSIRVLILHSALNESDPISCTIRHVRLSDESLKYEALSYTWGDNTQRHAIYIDDGTSELSVGKNCYDALRRLRRQHKDRKVWIDATCINQENLEERACQVRIMDVVYKKAIRVVIFLGEQVTECRALFEELAAIDEILDPWDRSYRPTRSETIIKQLENLFELPWFKRVWVLQEVHHKFVIFMYGSAKASFQAFERLYYKFWLPPHEINPWPIAMRGVCHRSIEMSTPQATLWSRLFDSRDCLATDPRDKVFALKALTGSRQSELSPLVNYSQSPAECFKQVAIFLLPVLGLRLLIAVRHPHGMDMPSWVPDWSQNLPLNRRDYAEIEPTREQNCEIRSSLDNENKICLELLITGSRYAKIVERSSVFMFDGVEDARKQMTHFYYSFDNLRKFVEAGDIHSNVNVEDMLGKNIADGKYETIHELAIVE